MEDENIRYSKTNDHKPWRAVDRYDVYSITDRNGKENVIYSPADSFDFSVEEARFYIEGEKAAFQYYNSRPISISSAIVGVGSSLLSFYSLPVPMIYSVVAGRFSPQKIHKTEGMEPAITESEPFKLGYQKAARNIKIQHSMKWGYIGLGTGLAGLIIYGVSTH